MFFHGFYNGSQEAKDSTVPSKIQPPSPFDASDYQKGIEEKKTTAKSNNKKDSDSTEAVGTAAGLVGTALGAIATASKGAEVVATAAITAGLGAIENQDPSAPKPAPHRLTMAEFLDKSEELFDTFDKDKDGVLRYDELAEAVEDPEIKGETAQTIAALYQNRKRIRKQDDDSTWFLDNDSKGITREDLKATRQLFNEKQIEHSNPYSLSSLKSHDTDQDGKLSKGELETALAKGELPKDEADLFKYYVANDDPEDPVKITDVLDYFVKNDMGDKDDRFLNKIDLVIARTHEAQSIGVSNLFGEGDDAEKKNIGIYGVEQGLIGDCYFVSTLAAVAQTNPQSIKDMICENPDGSYTVTFPGAKNEPITVQPITEAERGMFLGAAEHGTWAPIIEKAYGTYCQKKLFRREITNNWSGGNLPSEGADGGGHRLAHLIHLLTGKDADQDWLANPVPLLHWMPTSVVDEDLLTKTKLDATVGKNVEDKTAVVAWQKNWKTTGISDVTNHVYSVLDFDRDGADGGTLTLYNPWGHKETISYEQFKKRFMSVAYQQQK